MPTSALVLALAALWGQAAPLPLHTPADAIRWALSDAQGNGANAPYFRYLWLGNSSAGERAQLLCTANFAVNSLSRRRLLVPLAAVDLSGGSLVRVDLRAYGTDASAWENLGRRGSGPVVATKKIELPEPFFHYRKVTRYQEFTEKLVDCEPFRHANGQLYNQRWIKVPGKIQSKTELLQGPWLPQAEVAALCQLTGSDFPILEARWFIANALLPPAYQEFLGVKTLQDFDKLTRFREDDTDLAIKGIVLASSEVALHNRALLRTPTVLGYSWASQDHLSSVDDNDLLANVLGKKFDASEIIASAPNGLQQYLIVDGKGKVLDFADPNVAIDRSTGWNNHLVWTGLSCMVCHAKGLKSFREDVRRLASGNNRVFALVRDGKDAERFTDLFGPDIETQVTVDQAIYAATVQRTTGLTPEQNAANLSRIFLDYAQKPLSLADASLETGCSKDAILRAIKGARQVDHVLTQLIADSPVRRDQFEQACGQLMILLQR